MYASHEDVERIGRGLDGGSRRRRELPFVLCEYAHAMGNGPGGLADHQRIFERYERLQGGFVWEWIDHGVEHPGLGHAYGGDFGEELHDGDFVCDGLLFPDRRPSPGLVEYKQVIEPVRIDGDGADGTVRVTNAYGVRDLGHLEFTLSHEVDGVPAGGTHPLAVPPLAPGGSAEVKLPVPAPDGGGAEVRWTVRALLAEDTPWARRGHEVAWAQRTVARRAPAVPVTGAVPVHGGDRIVLGPGVFDARTGTLRSLCGVDVGGPRLDVWRAPTDNDEGASWQDGTRYGGLWRELGLHRMRHRTDAVDVDGGTLTVRTRVAPAARDVGLRTVYRWTSDGARLRLTVQVVPEGRWAVPLPRLGVRWGCPPPPRRAPAGTAAAARRTRTPGRRPGSGAGRHRSRSCTPRTSARRRTAPAATSAGWSSAACASRANRSSSSPPGAGPPSGWTPPGTAPIWCRATRCGSTSTTRSTASAPSPAVRAPGRRTFCTPDPRSSPSCSRRRGEGPARRHSPRSTSAMVRRPARRAGTRAPATAMATPARASAARAGACHTSVMKAGRVMSTASAMRGTTSS